MRQLSETLKHFIKNANLLAQARRYAMRRRLRNREFTLIASNCIGGIIYHELGVRFYSPTINLRIDSDQFARFVLRMDDYLGKELNFIPTEESCPVAMLGDIKIYFTHYKTAEDARQKWEERKNRIRRDNLFIVFNDRDGISEADMAALCQVKCRGMVMFSAKRRPEVSYALYMDRYDGQPCVGNVLEKSPLSGRRVYERYFDYVKWLNEANGSLDCRPFVKRGQ